MVHVQKVQCLAKVCNFFPRRLIFFTPAVADIRKAPNVMAYRGNILVDKSTLTNCFQHCTAIVHAMLVGGKPGRMH